MHMHECKQPNPYCKMGGNKGPLCTKERCISSKHNKCADANPHNFLLIIFSSVGLRGWLHSIFVNIPPAVELGVPNNPKHRGERCQFFSAGLFAIQRDFSDIMQENDCNRSKSTGKKEGTIRTRIGFDPFPISHQTKSK